MRPVKINGFTVPYEATIGDLLQKIDKCLPGERWAAAYALARKNENLPVQDISELYISGDTDKKRALLDVIGKHRTGVILSNIVLIALRDNDVLVNRAACHTAEKLKLTDGNDSLIALLDSRSIALKKDALSALRTAWKDDNFDAVYAVHTSDSNSELIKEAGWTLFSNANSTNWNKLFNLWNSDSFNRHRLWSCKLAEKYGTSDNIDALLSLSHDKDGHIRKASVRAINAINLRQDNLIT